MRTRSISKPRNEDKNKNENETTDSVKQKSLPQICGRDFCFTESVVSFSFLFLSSFRGLLMLLVRMEVTIDIAHS